MNIKNQLKDIKRRSFIKALTISGLVSFILPKKSIASFATDNSVSNVVVITNTYATDKVTQTINLDVVKSMIDEGIKMFTGMSTVGSAWKSIFPGITTSNVIGIKVNTIISDTNNGTHSEIAKAITDSLVQMNFGIENFPENNIIIYDFGVNKLELKGYILNSSETGVRCYPTASYDSTNYNVGNAEVGDRPIRLSTIVTDEIDFLINVAYLKNHGIAGTSLCLKNNYGSVNSPGNLHNTNGTVVYLPSINNLAPIKTKQKFCIIDALYGVASGGPYGIPTCNPDKIIMGTDIVAVDCVGRDLLNENGLSQSNYNLATRQLESADKTFMLGNSDSSNINVINSTGETSGIRELKNNSNDIELFCNSPNPFFAETEIKIKLNKTEKVQLNIFTYTGKQVRLLANEKLYPGDHSFTWNGAGESGENLAPGTYICRLTTESYSKSIVIQKIK